MLKQRLITAAILIPVTLLFLFYASATAFLFVTAAIVLAASWEWAGLMQLRSAISKLFYLLFVVSCMAALTRAFIPGTIFLAICWWLLALCLVIAYPRGSRVWASSVVVKGMMGLLVLLPCWLALNVIFDGQTGRQSILFLLLLIWGADSAAYFAGKKWGKTKLIPKVSPGKSVQGLSAAVLFAVLFSGVIAITGGVPSGLIVLFPLLCVVTVLFSVLGDLFESMLKRAADMKDSGSILPGHGGILDRIDSLTAAAPIYLFGKGLLIIYSTPIAG